MFLRQPFWPSRYSLGRSFFRPRSVGRRKYFQNSPVQSALSDCCVLPIYSRMALKCWCHPLTTNISIFKCLETLRLTKKLLKFFYSEFGASLYCCRGKFSSLHICCRIISAQLDPCPHSFDLRNNLGWNFNYFLQPKLVFSRLWEFYYTL